METAVLNALKWASTKKFRAPKSASEQNSKTGVTLAEEWKSRIQASDNISKDSFRHHIARFLPDLSLYERGARKAIMTEFNGRFYRALLTGDVKVKSHPALHGDSFQFTKSNVHDRKESSTVEFENESLAKIMKYLYSPAYQKCPAGTIFHIDLVREGIGVSQSIMQVKIS